MAFTKNFQELKSSDVVNAGGKGASLGEMTRVGLPVPPGFVVLVPAFDTFIRESNLAGHIEETLAGVNSRSMASLENASASIREPLLNAAMPEGVAADIEEAFRRLDAKTVAVRSSATVEDSAQDAWAGQLDTFLNVQGPDLLASVKKCWASLFTPRALSYQLESKLQRGPISVAVVIQRMVQSDQSGVAFSADPVTGNQELITIEACVGLGEALVSGAVTPDLYVVNSRSRSVVKKNSRLHSRALRCSESGGIEWVEIPKTGVHRDVLDEGQVTGLADLVVEIARHYGFPCDIEWAASAGKFYIVQSRPLVGITDGTEGEGAIGGALAQCGLFDRDLWWEQGQWVQPVLPYTFFSHGHFSSLLGRLFEGHNFGSAFSVDGHAFMRKEDCAGIASVLADQFEGGILHELVASLDSEGAALRERLERLTDRSGGSMSGLDEFVETYKQFAALWVAAVYIGEQVGGLAKTTGLVESDAALFEIVHPHLRRTWIEEEDEFMIGAALEFERSNDPKQLNSRLEDYVRRFPWIHIDKWQGEPIDLGDARKRFEEALRNVREGNNFERPRGQEHPSPIVSLCAAAAYWRAECTRIEKSTALSLRPTLQAAAVVLGLDFNLVFQLTPNELAALGGAKPADTKFHDLGKRSDGFLSVVTAEGNEVVLVAGSRLYGYFRSLFLDPNLGVALDELWGVAASVGIATGRVRVVNSIRDGATFDEGDILVAPETTPSFVPLMRIAGAILTGKGGITSHAAIVARGLQKPCVIDISGVTRQLATGDLVEVNAFTGRVRVLERAAQQ